MDSARDAAAVSDAVIQPSLWAALIEPPSGWPCVARSFQPYDETDDLLLKASQQFKRSWEEPAQQATTDVIDGLLIHASQQPEQWLMVPEEPVKDYARSRFQTGFSLGFFRVVQHHLDCLVHHLDRNGMQLCTTWIAMECNYTPLGFKVKLQMALAKYATLMYTRDAPQAPGGAVYCCGLCKLAGFLKSF